MPIELDHLFIFTALDAPEATSLREFGLLEGSQNLHPGQGTANRRFFFHNAMLELLWVRDPVEVQSNGIRRTRLWERSRAQTTGFAPLGVCVRLTGEDSSLPFETWPFQPPYLPEGVSIPVALNDDYPIEPMIFAIPFGGRPDAAPSDKREPFDHPAGLREISRVMITLPHQKPLSAAAQALAAAEVMFLAGNHYLVTVEFDHVTRQQQHDFRPALPLCFNW